jgi:hypothetical protein
MDEVQVSGVLADPELAGEVASLFGGRAPASGPGAAALTSSG